MKRKLNLIQITKYMWYIKDLANTTLVYSEDDNERCGKGWYWSNPTGTSDLYATKKEAIDAYKNETIEWEFTY